MRDIVDVVVIKVKLVWGEVGEVGYLWEFGEEWIVVGEWDVLKDVDIVEYINGRMKYMDRVWVGMVVEEWEVGCI